MRYKEIGLGMGRSIRLEPYNVIRPEARIVVEIDPFEDPGRVLDELKKDLNQILDELELEEASRQGFAKGVDGKYYKMEVTNEAAHLEG